MTTDPAQVTRIVDTTLAVDDLWELVANADSWATWMVDSAELAVEPGASGTVTDGGVERVVRVERVRPAERVVFTWWPTTDPGLASTVSLVVLPRPSGSLLRITETFPATVPAQASASISGASIGWDVRTALLAFLALAPVPVG